MSHNNGDRARTDKQRKRKMVRREKSKLLRKELEAAKPKPAAQTAS